MKEPDPDREKIFKLESAVKSGAGWFTAIALCSIINSYLIITKSSLNFIIGLGITQVIDYFALSKTPGGTGIESFLGFIINLLIAGIFIVFAYYAKRRERWAFTAGMIVYGLDSLIMLAVGDYLSFGFHVLALIYISKGLVKLQELNKITAVNETVTRNGELQTAASGYADSTSVVICPNCSTEVKDIYNYCMNCGEKIR